MLNKNKYVIKWLVASFFIFSCKSNEPDMGGYVCN